MIRDPFELMMVSLVPESCTPLDFRRSPLTPPRINIFAQTEMFDLLISVCTEEDEAPGITRSFRVKTAEQRLI